MNPSLIQKFIDKCRGRHTAFAVFFAGMGTVMEWFHKLDSNYIALIAVIQGWVFARSWSEDKYKKAEQHDQPQ